MPHEFLLHSDWRTRWIHEGTIRAPEHVPADPEQADLLTVGLEDLLVKHARVVATARDV